MTSLTKDQKQAVETVDRNVCVSAGAGTGKTRVLVERFLHLISSRFAQTSEILAITFTEKAAQEMKSRIAARLKQEGLEQARRDLENAYIGTIHSFCSRILREHPIEAGVDPEFRVLQEEEADLLKEAALEELIETRFQEPEVFNLFCSYSDPEIRVTLKRLQQLSFRDDQVLNSSATPQNDIAEKVLAALKPLAQLKGKESDCAEAKRVIQSSISDWNQFEEAGKIGGLFRKNQAKPEIGIFKDAFDEWLSAKAERLGEKSKNVLLNLASEFESRYSALKTERSSLDFNDLERKALELLSGDSSRSAACRNLYQKKFRFIMVDEFQDTSPIQDKIISLIARSENLFIVGDWKQSIYGFRGSDASVLIEKEKSFEQGSGQKISLADNFRSRKEILDGINTVSEFLFAQSLEYEPLKVAVIARSEATKQSKTEIASTSIGMSSRNDTPCIDFLVIPRDEGESMAQVRMNEARVLAERISALVKTGNYEYRDFAMLFRATTDLYFYEYELRSYDIPYYIVGGRGFYKQPEIRDIISFLELLENPHLDIPLAAVLRSPFVQISDDALFWLANRSRRLEPSRPLYEALLQFEIISELGEADKEKLAEFRAFLFQLLSEKEKWSISECIELIVERTKYDRYVLHLPHGKRHFANIRKLLEVAREVEIREPVHLGDFIRYIKGLEMQEVRESEAQVEALEGNVVKLMTIHKAKGLEFKVVLLPDLNRRGEKRGNSFLVDSEYGIGFKAFNEATRKPEETLTYRKIKEKMIQASAQEAKRLLYVAMTRAQDHLILSGSSKGEEENNFGGFDEGANWFEWIQGAFKAHVVEIPKGKSGRHVLPLAEHKKIKSAIEKKEPVAIKVPEAAEQLIEFLKPIEPAYFERIDLPVSAYAVFQHDQEEFRKTYEFGVLPEESVIPARFRRESASRSPTKTFGDDKDEEWAETEDEEAETLSATDFGTVIHKIFEHLVAHPEKAQVKLKFWLGRFQNSLSETTFKEIQALSGLFLKSGQFADIRSAKKRYPEIPFVLRLHHGIIQGTLDLLYQNEKEEWIILDYKTSVIASPVLAGRSNDDIDLKSHAERYQGQMLLYALACHELLGIKPKSAVLYFARVDRSFEFSLLDVDYEHLHREFGSIQKQILDLRKNWTAPLN